MKKTKDQIKKNMQAVKSKGSKIEKMLAKELWKREDWQIKKHEIKSNMDFWYNKIEKNIERDKMVTDELTKQGWVVLRFWGNDIKKETDKCINKIEEKIIEKKWQNIQK